MTHEQDPKDVGAEIRKLREAQGKSQEDVAFEAGIDQSTYSKIERQGPQVVSWPKFLKVVEVLGCAIEIKLRPKSSGC